MVVLASHSAQLSGAEIAMARVAMALTRYEPHALLGEDGPIADMLRGAGVPVQVLPIPEELRSLNRYERLDHRLLIRSRAAQGYIADRRALLRALRPVLVHTNSLKSGLLTGPAARLAGVPLVWHLRDHLSPHYLSLSSLTLARTAIRGMTSVAIANSASTRATLPRGVPACVINSPIDSLGAPRTDPGAPGDGLTFTALGRLAPWKGQALFLRAFARAFPTGPHRALVVGGPLFGEDEYERELRHLVERLDLHDRVEFTGHVDHPREQLDRTDVLVHSSVIPEPFGLVVVEGMSAGLAVVAADAGGPAETITPGVDGILYRRADERALADRLQQLAGDPQLRRSLGEAARDTARGYLPDAIAARIETVYDEVAASRGWRARHVAINGRFLTRPVTGVERFATNIASRIETPSLVLVPTRVPFARGLVGHLWEQVVLPQRVSRNAVLWSPCNFGPLAIRRQVVTVHDLAPVDHPEWFTSSYGALFRGIIPRLCRRVDAVTTVSSFTRDRLVEYVGLEQRAITIVPNGCEFSHLVPGATDTDADTGTPARYVLAVGSVDPRKNLVGICQAMSIVQDRHPDVELRVIGSAATGVFAATTDLDVDRFLGHVSDAELLDLYRHADCLVYASFYEGFGLPPLEAMAVGTRVVASNLPPLEELCGDAAIYVDPTDATDIARGIADALSEPASVREEALRRGRARAEHMSWRDSASKLDEVLRATFNSSQRRHHSEMRSAAVSSADHD